MTLAIVLMGVSGSGKTAVGQALADELGWPFYDGDDYHPAENVAKMAGGISLDDTDRTPWLQTLRDLIAEHLQAGKNLVLACSALKERYRQQLREGNDGLIFVHLYGDFDLIWSRMRARQEHYMKPEMLRSQFDVLEVPSDALVIDIGKPVLAIVSEIIQIMDLEPEN